MKDFKLNNLSSHTKELEKRTTKPKVSRRKAKISTGGWGYLSKSIAGCVWLQWGDQGGGGRRGMFQLEEKAFHIDLCFPSSTPTGSLLCCLLLLTVCVVSAHVCMPVLACACMCASDCLYLHVCVCLPVQHACMRVFACACMCMCVRARVRLPVHACGGQAVRVWYLSSFLIHSSFFFLRQGLSQSQEFTDSSSLQVSGIYSSPLNSGVTGTGTCCHAPLLQGV